jgi:hypothetical protein
MLKNYQHIILLFLLSMGMSSIALAQTTEEENYNIDNLKSFKLNDTTYIKSNYNFLNNCKAPQYFGFFEALVKGQQQLIELPVSKFLRVHGNILYDFSYRSFLDTPLAQQDLMQHLVQTRLDFVVKEKYPVTMLVTYRNSNSPFFKNTFDVNVQMNQRQFAEKIKADIKAKIVSVTNTNLAYLRNIESAFIAQKKQLEEKRQWLNSSARAEEIVAAKVEMIKNKFDKENITNQIVKNIEPLNQLNTAFENIKGINFEKINFTKNLKYDASFLSKIAEYKNNIITDQAGTIRVIPIDTNIIQTIAKKQQEYDSLKLMLKQKEAEIIKAKKSAKDSLQKKMAFINKLKTPADLKNYIKENKFADSLMTKGQKILLAVRQIGIGRSWIDYSDLTVKNISLAGVNIELNPNKFYVALAGGKVNYRFRDFIFKNNNSTQQQSLGLVRLGYGNKDQNNIIFTYYQGKKSLLSNIINGTQSPLQKVVGFAVETKLVVNENNYLVGEVAKSSFSPNSNLSGSLASKALDFKVRTNEAYSIKLFSQNPKTFSRLTAYYRKMGENFQSFNLSPINVNQEAWMVRLNQSFFKNKLTLDGAIRKNDFESPYALQNFTTTNIFKSFQATLKVPKYPFVSIGYYPSSMLSLQNNNVLVESQYNTLNAVISHTYKYKSLGMNTNATITKFYNNSNDTGFIYFNATTYTMSQSVVFPKLTAQTTLGYTDQLNLKLYSLEQMINYNLNRNINVNGALKLNKIKNGSELIGGTLGMNMLLGKLGSIQLTYDKSYIQNYQQVLQPVDMGRIIYMRTF